MFSNSEPPVRRGAAAGVFAKPLGPPERWMARRRETGKLEPVDVYRIGNAALGDIICPIGSADGHEARYWQLLRVLPRFGAIAGPHKETVMTDFEERVRIKANLLWQREGKPEGQSERHWQQAKTMIAAERGKKPVLPSMVITGPWRAQTRGR